MAQRNKGATLFALGTVLMVSVVVLGKFFLPELQASPPEPFSTLQGSLAMLKFGLFAAGFPLGVGLCVWGAALMSGTGQARAFAAAAVAGPLLMLLVPGLFGAANSPFYFGTGGIAIMGLVVLVLWSWGRYRAALAPALRAASDWQALGYFCFALATWTLCGVGGMPGFALYPDRMQQAGTHFLAVANLKSVMAFLVLGWAFTLIGFRKALQAQRP